MRGSWILLLAGLLPAACGGGEPRRGPAPFPGAEALHAQTPPSMQACVECHPRVVHAFLQNGMARTFGVLTDADLEILGESDWILSPNSGYRYRVESLEGRSWIAERLDAPHESFPEHLRRQPLAVWIGAGVQDASLVAIENGRWYFAPLERFTEHEWDLSPTEHRPVPHGLGRPITSECLGCHTSMKLPDIFPRNRFGSLQPEGIDCSACHGSAGDHVERMRSGDPLVEPGILNPRSLPAGRQLDVCSRCHLQGDARFELGGAAYAPGDDLLTGRAAFVAANPDDDFGFVSQTERLAMSACFRGSPEMTCTTCHDPHLPSRLQPKAELAGACTACHAEPHAKEPVEMGSQDCIDCHMRRSQPFDLDHVVIHDHFIRAEPPPPAPHASIRERETKNGRVKRFVYRDSDPSRFTDSEEELLEGMALVNIGQFEQAAQKFTSLDPPGRGPLSDPQASSEEPAVERLPLLHFARGRALESRDDFEGAAAAYADALALDPAYPEARINRANVLLRLDRLSEARSEAERAANEFPDAESPWNLLAQIAEQEGSRGDAARALGESLKRHSQQAAVWRALAQIQESAGDLRSAVESLKSAYAIDPRLDGLMDDIARVSSKLR